MQVANLFREGRVMKQLFVLVLAISFIGCSDEAEEAENLANSGSITLVPPPGGLDALIAGQTALVQNDEYALTSLIFPLTELSLGTESGDSVEWEVVFDESTTSDPVTFDLLKGEGDEQLISGITPGTYPFVRLKFSSISYQRGEGSDCEEMVLTDTPGGGILTTAEEFESRGQSIGSGLDITPPDDGLGPSDIDPDIDDDLFWILTSEVEMISGANSTLIVTALSDEDYVKPGPCDEGPGKPNFVVGTSESIKSFYESVSEE